MPGANVLVVDDEADVRDIVATGLKVAGFDVSTAPDGHRAVDLIRENTYHGAIIDLFMPGLSGIETAKKVKELAPATEIIICTGKPSLESAIEAIRGCVADYICKPVNAAELRRAVQTALERRKRWSTDEEGGAILAYRSPGEGKEAPSALIGESEGMAKVRKTIAEVGPADVTVLIRGETGTGKDLVAHLIHRASRGTRKGSFVKVNCPAVPESLLESELFGHEPGAFTGATRRKPGRFELAGGGTVFLDEIGAVPIASQAKLLQVIESRQFTRLGGGETVSVEARFLAATNEALEEAMGSGRFRADLFYRLNEFAISLPPLRHRPEDIPLLVAHFLGIYGDRYGRTGLELSPEAMRLLVEYRWPGNVRQLESVVKRVALTGSEDYIRQDLHMDPVAAGDSGNRMRETEAKTVLAALEEARWNQRRAAKILGISYSALRRRMAKYDIKP